MNERYKDDRAVIDLMLAHVPNKKVEGAYNPSGIFESSQGASADLGRPRP
jgi:hypothetical protein